VTSGTAPARPAAGPRWWLAAAGAVGALGVTAALALGGWLPALDERVAALAGRWDLRGSVVGVPLRVVAEVGGRGVLVAVLLVVAAVAAWRSRSARPLLRAGLALVALTVVVGAAKLGTGRAAPSAVGGAAALFRGGDSFPSGHVANAVVVWGLVHGFARELAREHRVPAGVLRGAAVAAVAGPVVAGVAVLLLGFHWVSDVVAGAALGVSLLGVVHALDGVALSLWVRARAGRRSA
jgi:membrane-associated phospholipid phosphatase